MTATNPVAHRDDWREALLRWSNADWSDLDSWVQDGDSCRSSLVTALVAAYDAKADGDNDIVRACIVATEERHGPIWSVEQFQAVVQSFAVCLPGGWSQLAQDYLDDHYPGLPGSWLNDLTAIGKEVKRDSEQYVTLDSSDALYVFTRPA